MVTMRPPYFFGAVRAMLSPSNVMTSGYLCGDGSDQPAVLRQSVAEQCGHHTRRVDDSTGVHTERCHKSRRSDRLYEPPCHGQTTIGNNRRLPHDPVNHIVCVPGVALSDSDHIRLSVSDFARSGPTP
jgi:hypothetical protein